MRATTEQRRPPAYRKVVAETVSAVCEGCGLTADDLLGPSRERRASRPRQVAYYLIREISGAGTPTIGATFGRDHSTVIHGLRAVEEALYRRDAWAIAILDAVTAAQARRVERARSAAEEAQARARRTPREYLDPYEMPPPCHAPDDAPTPPPPTS